MKQLIFSLVLGMAQERGMDPYRIAAIAQVESSFNQNAIGGLGEVGIFQLRPELYLKDKYNYDLFYYLEVSFNLLEDKREKCRKYSKSAWVVCWNRGITGTKKIVDTLYKTSYYKKVSKYYEEIQTSCKSKSKTWRGLRCAPLSIKRAGRALR